MLQPAGSVSQVLQDYAKAMFRKSLDTHTEELEMEASDGDRSPRKPPEEPKELAKASEVEASPPCTKRFDKNDIEAALGRIKLEVSTGQGDTNKLIEGEHSAEYLDEITYYLNICPPKSKPRKATFCIDCQ